jgi:hypothetical protein
VKNHRPLAVLVAAVLATGCAGTIKNMRELPADAALPAPAPGKALVVFMRPSGMGYAIQSSVFEVREGKPEIIGIVAAKAKVAQQVDPGQHLFMVASEAGDFMTADVLPGRTYYALVTPRPGMWKARFSLAPLAGAELGSDQFNEWFNACRLVEPGPETAAWMQENRSSVEAKYAKYYPEWMSKPEADRPKVRPDDGQ